MLVGMVQKGSARAHWYAKVRTCDTVLIPTGIAGQVTSNKNLEEL